jgi:uncharacterized protein DUF1302
MRKELSGKKPNTWTPLKIISRNYKTMVFLLTTAFCLSFAMVNMGHAVDFGDSSSGFYGGMDVTLSYNSMFRVEGQDSGKAGMTDPNADDGNRNFDEGIVSSQFKVVGEFEIRKDFPALSGSTAGFFARGFALYDPVLADSSTDHDSPVTNNNGPLYNGTLSDNQSFTDAVENIAGKNVDILDLLIYGEAFTATDHALSFKLGRHVVNWGESAFILNGIGPVVNPLDGQKANLPGSELKEILIPINQLSSNFQLSTNFSINGFYQFEWKETLPPFSGAYFSDKDMFGEGAQNLLIPSMLLGLVPGQDVALPFIAVDRGGDDEGRNSGQWGVSLSWFADFIQTELAFYYANYHRRLPSLTFKATGQGSVDATIINPAVAPPDPRFFALMGFDSMLYTLRYHEDVKLFAMSFNTNIPLLETSVSGEFAYHDNIPIQTMPMGAAFGMIGAGGPGTVVDTNTREELIVTQVTFNPTISSMLKAIADDTALLVELGMIYTPNLDDGESFLGGGATDQFSWGYKAQLGLTYFDAIGKMFTPLSGTDLLVTASFSHDVDGNAPIPLGFVANTKSAGIKFEGRWHDSVSAEFGYNIFFGNGDKNALADRDNITFVLKWRM